MTKNTKDVARFIAVADGVEVACWDLGNSANHIVSFNIHAPTFLFVHANGFCSQVFTPMAAFLLQTIECRCVAIDLRGHGHSECARGDLDWAVLGADVGAVIDQLGLTSDQHNLVGVGHSMGAAALLLDAAGSTEHFDAIWGYEPIVMPPETLKDRQGPNHLSEVALRRRRHFDSVAAAIANYSAKPPMASFDKKALAAYVEFGFKPKAAPDGGITLRCEPETEAAYFQMGPNPDQWATLNRIECTTKIVSGAPTPMTPAALAESIAGQVPNGRYELMGELDHFGPFVDPKRCAKSVLELLESIYR